MTIYIETLDTVECCELLATTVATEPEENPGTTHPPGGWTLVVPAGKIFGFVTENLVSISNPNSSAVITIYADGKNPWPLPPPLSPLASRVSDFPTRYQNFLMTGGLSGTTQPIVMTLAPAHTTP